MSTPETFWFVFWRMALWGSDWDSERPTARL